MSKRPPVCSAFGIVQTFDALFQKVSIAGVALLSSDELGLKPLTSWQRNFDRLAAIPGRCVKFH